MRLLAALLVIAPLGACDLQPPPKQQPGQTPGSAAAAPSASPTPTPALPPAPPLDAAAAGPDAFDVTQKCLDVSVHIADVMIKEARDPGSKAALEQDKTRIVRRAAEGCTRDQWPDTAHACFLKAETVAAMEICGKDLKSP
ncbi:MAG: hypothetical protein SFX73_19000 [Kofleriaceae bacterium]|nr:hypothetical protein [Kofleriaceae bacterium]